MGVARRGGSASAAPGTLRRAAVVFIALLVITRRDASDAVVMSLDTFNSLMETVHLLKSPANAAHLARSIEQYRKGKTKAQDLMDA